MEQESRPQDNPLDVKVEGGMLVISVGVETLANALELGDDCTVIDPELFARDIAIELEQEAEDGTTPVHEMLDVAANKAIENGSLAVNLT